MESGRSGSDGSASAKLFSSRDVEKGVQRRSRSKVSSTYPTMGKEPVSAGSGLGGWNVYVCGTFFTAALLTAILNILHQLLDG